MELMDEIAARTLPPGTSYEWTAMSYQENIVGNQLLLVFALAIVLVYLCLAGQYESWIAPVSVMLAVALWPIGPALVLGGPGAPDNIFTPIGLRLPLPLNAKTAIPIVQGARQAPRI